MLRTALLLIFTLVVVPIIAFYFDEPLTAEQLAIFKPVGFTALGIALTCFILAELTKNYSQTDKIWSIAPLIYAWMIVILEGSWDPRLLLMAALVSLWGIRLTYNFGRRGGYKWKFWEGEEDYRWSILQSRPPFHRPAVWSLFNLFFISLYQNGLILLFTLPMLVAVKGVGQPLGSIDIILAVLILALLFIETRADQQQWDYQTEKYRRKNNNEPLDGNYLKGFVDTGLWGLMRHPNYAAEQSIWIVFYFYSVAATGQWINWSMVGCLLLLILFKSSSDFSEEISASKYPDYKEYQQRVPRFFPRLLPRNVGQEASERAEP
jgi:steroid 5-alpha reductase family enzyme